jgi:hypothetical protein
MVGLSVFTGRMMQAGKHVAATHIIKKAGVR